MNDRIRFLKTSILSEFFLSSIQIYSTQLLLKEKKVFLKKSCFTFNTKILLDCLVLYDKLCVGIIE